MGGSSFLCVWFKTKDGAKQCPLKRSGPLWAHRVNPVKDHVPCVLEGYEKVSWLGTRSA